MKDVISFILAMLIFVLFHILVVQMIILIVFFISCFLKCCTIIIRSSILFIPAIGLLFTLTLLFVCYYSIHPSKFVALIWLISLLLLSWHSFIHWAQFLNLTSSCLCDKSLIYIFSHDLQYSHIFHIFPLFSLKVANYFFQPHKAFE